MENKKGCISMEEMGRRLGISRPMAYDVAHMEGFPALRIGRLLIIESRFEEWLENGGGVLTEPGKASGRRAGKPVEQWSEQSFIKACLSIGKPCGSQT